jgi:hypothetical protein
MKNDQDKTIYVGVTGTRINFTSWGGFKTMCRDLVNDAKLALTDSALSTRNGTTSAMVEKIAK